MRRIMIAAMAMLAVGCTPRSSPTRPTSTVRNPPRISVSTWDEKQGKYVEKVTSHWPTVTEER